MSLLKEHNFHVRTNQDQTYTLMHTSYFQTGDPYWDGDVSWDSHECNCGTYPTENAAETAAIRDILSIRHENNIKHMIEKAAEKEYIEILNVLLLENRTTLLYQITDLEGV